jgi:hypothetical protein
MGMDRSKSCGQGEDGLRDAVEVLDKQVNLSHNLVTINEKGAALFELTP